MEGNMAYRLKDLKNGVYQIHSEKKGAFEGTLQQIFNKSVEMGCASESVEKALVELNRLNHKVAEFGISGHFMYTLRE